MFITYGNFRFGENRASGEPLLLFHSVRNYALLPGSKYLVS
jgi:hypothetical protein